MRRLFILGLVLANCARPSRGERFTLRVAAIGPFAPLRPNTAQTFSAVAHDLVFESILNPTRSGGVASGLTRDWDPVDAHSGRFRLRAGRVFSDGSPVTPDDVVRSLRTAGIDARTDGEWIVAQAKDDTITIEEGLARAAIFHQTSNGPIGSGPFHVTREDDHHITLDRLKAVPHRIERVEFDGYADSRQALARLLIGDDNAILMPEPRQLELLQDVPRLKVVRSPGIQAAAIIMNAARNDARQRRNLRDALPVASIAREAFGNDCQPLTRPGNPETLLPGRPFDITTAVLNPIFDRGALALRRALGRRGGRVLSLDIGAAARRYETGDYDLFVLPLQVWPPSEALSRWHRGNPINGARYANNAFDAAVDRGDYLSAQSAFDQDPAAILLCMIDRTAAVDARIVNPSLGPYDLLQTLPEWEVAP